MPGTPNDYDAFAAAYAADNEANLSNAHYERLAILVLAGAVAGRRMLDAGCGSGLLAAAPARAAAGRKADHLHPPRSWITCWQPGPTTSRPIRSPRSGPSEARPR